MRPSLSACLAFCLLPLAVQAADVSGRVVLPSDVRPTRYDLSITPDAAHMTFAGTVRIALDVKSAANTIKFNSAELELGNIELDGKAAPNPVLDNKEQTATLTLPAR